MICDYLPKEYTAYSFLVSYATVVIGNGNVPMGASLQMSLRMEKRFKELGGQIFYNTGVEKIVLEKKHARGITLEGGEFVPADYVIPAIDSYPLFNRLLPQQYMPKELCAAYSSPKKYPVTSGFQIAFAVDESFVANETVFVDIDDIKIGNHTFDRMYIKYYGYDPLFVHDGKQVIQTCITQTDSDLIIGKACPRMNTRK